MVIAGLFLMVCMAVVIAALFFLIGKKSRTEKTLREENGHLKKRIKELKLSYQEASGFEKELKARCLELEESREKNRRLAYQDYLTGLPNRNYFMEKLEEAVETADEEHLAALAYLDVDDFKAINDTLGHSYGDELLIDITERLKQVMQPLDYLARFGGDEFIILSKDLSDLSEYEEKIKKIQNIFSYPFILAMKEFFVTVSIGIIFLPKDGKSSQALLRNVDSAMYNAKAIGKNTYCFYDLSMNEELTEQMEMQSRLVEAIRREEFCVYYQARVHLSDNKMTGMEAFVRWNHPEQGMISPEAFMPVAEKTGLIVPIGEWVLRKACRCLKKWEEDGYGLTMSVSLSARQFMDKSLPEMVKSILEETKIMPQHLELEITETSAFKDIGYTLKRIHELKDMGVCVLLKDFGTEDSVLACLKKLPVDSFQLDKNLLAADFENEDRRKLATAVINLVKAMGVSVTAEGVESEEQESFLRSAGCDRAQGYLYSGPLSEKEAGFLLKNQFL